MAVMFVLGFFLDTFEIIFIMLPIFGPPLLKLGYDPVWLGVMVGINLQTSFLTPPFGATLFYMRGVAPPEITHRRHLDGLDPAGPGSSSPASPLRLGGPGARHLAAGAGVRLNVASRTVLRVASPRSFRLRLCRSADELGRIDGWKRSCA